MSKRLNEQVLLSEDGRSDPRTKAYEQWLAALDAKLDVAFLSVVPTYSISVWSNELNLPDTSRPSLRVVAGQVAEFMTRAGFSTEVFSQTDAVGVAIYW
jgi:hypothetical protein